MLPCRVVVRHHESRDLTPNLGSAGAEHFCTRVNTLCIRYHTRLLGIENARRRHNVLWPLHLDVEGLIITNVFQREQLYQTVFVPLSRKLSALSTCVTLVYRL